MFYRIAPFAVLAVAFFLATFFKGPSIQTIAFVFNDGHESVVDYHDATRDYRFGEYRFTQLQNDTAASSPRTIAKIIRIEYRENGLTTRSVGR
jgi:hypothetical protein